MTDPEEAAAREATPTGDDPAMPETPAVAEPAAEPEAKPAPAKAYRAKLDADGIYWGVEEVDALGDADFKVPADCDLKPGAYRLNADAKRMDPLLPQHVKLEPAAPDFQRAFYDLAAAMHARDGALPASTLAWCLAYEASFDAGNGRDLAYFRSLPA